MMKKKYILVLVAAFAFGQCVLSSAETLADTTAIAHRGLISSGNAFLRPIQKRDSVLIADQLKYGALLEGVEEGTDFGLPDYSKGFIDSVEVVSSWTIDTLKTKKIRKSKVYDIEASVILTSFDEGLYQLPPLVMARRLPGGKIDTLVFAAPKPLEVKTMPVDTTTFTPHDIKGQIRYPVTFKEVLPYIGLGLLMVALIALAVYLIRRYRARGENQVVEEAPHIAALRKLDKFRGNKFWAPEKQKIFYSGVTDALREYLVARYGFGAMEMTTAEIFRDLRKTDVPKYLFEDMKGLFERSDFVKYAKLTVSDEDNAKVIPAAVRFVTDTYQAVLDAEAAAQEAAQQQTETPSDEDKTPMEKVKPQRDDTAYMPKGN